MEQPKYSVEIGGINFTFTAREFKPGDVDMHVERETYTDPETGEVFTFSKESMENLLSAINGI